MPTPQPKPRQRRRTLVEIHAFMREHEGDRAAYDWLVATVSRLSERLDAQKREITTLKSHLTKNKNVQRIHSRPTARNRSHETN